MTPRDELAAALAAMSADQLDAALGRVSDAVSGALADETAVRATDGASSLQLVDEAQGDALWAAMNEVARFKQTRRHHHALAALEHFVAALGSRRDAWALVSTALGATVR